MYIVFIILLHFPPGHCFLIYESEGTICYIPAFSIAKYYEQLWLLKCQILWFNNERKLTKNIKSAWAV